MEEASSIAKAVEQAWLRAGQPGEFTVKVFEEPKKNFFGLTVQPAKIAILFSQQTSKASSKAQKSEQRRRDRPQTQKSMPARTRSPQESRGERRQQPRQQQRSQQQERRRPDQRRPDQRTRQASPQPASPPRAAGQQETSWTPDMVQAARDWIQESLVMMDKKAITFSTDVNRNYLNVRFNTPILKGSDQEMLFKSWSNLIMQSLRDTFKKDLRNLRVSFGGSR